MTNLCITAASFLLSSLFVVPSSPVQLNADPCQRDGPEYWCRNQQTATECGILNFCKKRGFKLAAITNNVVKPLQFELYFESLCPDCRNFFKEQLWPVQNTSFFGVFSRLPKRFNLA
uniref:Saposin A-type domain-containing protein n=1 Tax=Clytia hemisphaerica TaxID=252671 RepID=A0A7M5XPB8_9CNID